LLNIDMGNEDAFSILSKIRLTSHLLPVIVLASEQERPLAERALRKGASAYIIKPIPKEEMVSHVKDVLDKSALENISGKESIMIIDDEKEITDMLKGFLNSNGYSCFVVNNPKLAPALIKKHKPLLVFLDIMMPEINGIDLLDQIKEIEKRTRVMMVSGVYDNDICANAIKKGASGYITKPFSLQQIKAAVITALLQ